MERAARDFHRKDGAEGKTRWSVVMTDTDDKRGKSDDERWRS